MDDEDMSFDCEDIDPRLLDNDNISDKHENNAGELQSMDELLEGDRCSESTTRDTSGQKTLQNDFDLSIPQGELIPNESHDSFSMAPQAQFGAQFQEACMMPLTPSHPLQVENANFDNLLRTNPDNMSSNSASGLSWDYTTQDDNQLNLPPYVQPDPWPTNFMGGSDSIDLLNPELDNMTRLPVLPLPLHPTTACKRACRLITMTSTCQIKLPSVRLLEVVVR